MFGKNQMLKNEQKNPRDYISLKLLWNSIPSNLYNFTDKNEF